MRSLDLQFVPPLPGTATQTLARDRGLSVTAKAVLLWVVSFLCFWGFASPGLDEIDSVNFAICDPP